MMEEGIYLRFGSQKGLSQEMAPELSPENVTTVPLY